MRILLTTDTVGGVWTFTQELSAELLRRGHFVALLSFGREPSASQTQACNRLRVSYGERFRYEASAAPLEWMEGNERAYSEGTAALLVLAESFCADIVHSSQFCFGDLPLSVPVVITAHSDVLSWAAACRPHGLEPSAWLTRYRSLVECGLQHATAVVAPTQWMSETLCQLYPLRSKPKVILNGRNLSGTSGVPKRHQAVSVGRLWDEAKNLTLLTKVASPIPILVAGEQRFEASEAGLERGALTFLGPLAEQDILDLFLESSLYLGPSRYEPFGLAPLEAAQCGCALLLNDLPSFREIWGDAALYFQDAGSLSHLLATLSPQSILGAQQRAQERARQLTATCMAAQYESLYRELLAKSSAESRELISYAH